MGLSSAFEEIKDNVAKYCRTGQATDDNMAQAQCTLGA
jgi:hypothetical protein